MSKLLLCFPLPKPTEVWAGGCVIQRHTQTLCIIACLLGLLLSAIDGLGQGYPCDGAFYYVATDHRDGSSLYKGIVNEIDHSFIIEALPLDNSTNRHITCLGYNVQDQNLYALDFNTFELLRLPGDGQIISLGIPENLDTNFVYYAGEMTPDGRRLVVLARNPTSGKDERIYSIRVNNAPDYYAGFFSVISESPVAMSDITVDPIVGTTYGYDLLRGQVIETDRTGLTSANHRAFEQVSQDLGSLFFDRFGQMYGLGSPSRGGGTQNQIYQVSKLDGSTTQLGSAPGGFDTDGCGCPYGISFYKSIAPRKTQACNRVEITYEAINHAGIGQVGLNVMDALPDAFTIEDILLKDLFNIQINSGVGTSFLDLDRWTLLLGSNVLTLIVDIGDVEPQVLASQGTLNNLPYAYGTTLPSDDPTTSELDDATTLEIVPIDDIKLADRWWVSCQSDTAFLTLPIDGDFMWSNGAQTSMISVVEPGLYSVTVSSECYEYRDSAQISFDREPLRVDLGPDQTYPLGEVVQLSFESNGRSGALDISWSSSDSLELSCTTCPNPQLIARKSAQVNVTVTDLRGCIATDELLLSVDKSERIYIPSAFSPNGDGLNDIFRFFGRSATVESLQIFDRWGNLIESKKANSIEDENHGWDGSHQGGNLAPGIYLWTSEIRFADRSTKKYSGEVLLFY